MADAREVGVRAPKHRAKKSVLAGRVHISNRRPRPRQRDRRQFI